MAKYKSYNYSQTVMLSVSLEDQLMPGTIEFAIHTLVEERMDVSRFDERHRNDETGCKAYNPKVLLKIVLLAYARGINTSRKIEKACKENVVFMAMSCGQEPDHSTIAAFVSNLKEEIKPLFRDVLLVCEEMKLLGGTEFSLDGCKLPSNASMRWSGTFSTLKEKKEKIERRVSYILEEQIEADRREGKDGSEETRRAKHIEKLKKQAARIEEFLQENEPKPGKLYKEVRSNVTDNESAMLYTSHGTIQGYNAQALVDAKHQVIVEGEAFGWGQDHTHVPPVLDGAKENMQALGHDDDYFEGAIVTADVSYHSTTNIKKCEDEKVDAYIPDRYYRGRDPRFEKQRGKQRRFELSDFSYNEETDRYECPNGKVLKINARKSKHKDKWYRSYKADENDCSRCELRNRCITQKRARRKVLMVQINKNGINYSRQMIAKIDSARGRELYSHRTAIVEPVFANIRTHKKLDCFTLRGKIKVTIQWLLYCMVHNIEKIANFGHGFAVV